MNSINRRLKLLGGIMPQAIALLQDQQLTPDVTRILRNIKTAGQIEAVKNFIDRQGQKFWNIFDGC